MSHKLQHLRHRKMALLHAYDVEPWVTRKELAYRSGVSAQAISASRSALFADGLINSRQRLTRGGKAALAVQECSPLSRRASVATKRARILPLLNDGWSYGVIAKKIGWTRSMVAGFVYRAKAA